MSYNFMLRVPTNKYKYIVLLFTKIQIVISSVAMHVGVERQGRGLEPTGDGRRRPSGSLRPLARGPPLDLTGCLPLCGVQQRLRSHVRVWRTGRDQLSAGRRVELRFWHEPVAAFG
jgi:hypothetical protein